MGLERNQVRGTNLVFLLRKTFTLGNNQIPVGLCGVVVFRKTQGFESIILQSLIYVNNLIRINALEGLLRVMTILAFYGRTTDRAITRAAARVIGTVVLQLVRGIPEMK